MVTWWGAKTLSINTVTDLIEKLIREGSTAVQISSSMKAALSVKVEAEEEKEDSEDAGQIVAAKDANLEDHDHVYVTDMFAYVPPPDDSERLTLEVSKDAKVDTAVLTRTSPCIAPPAEVH